MIIGLDTSHNKTYSCLLFGFKNDINEVYNKISRVLAKHGRPGIIHWQKLSGKIRKAAKNEIYEIVNNSPLSFYIFEHDKPRDVPKNEYYLFTVPNFIASYMERRLRGKFGTVLIEADDDYTISNVKNSTLRFVENFIAQVCFRLIGKQIKLRKDGKIRATVKHSNGNVLDFIGYETNRTLSNAVQLSDLILGYYFYDNKGLEKVDLQKLK